MVAVEEVDDSEESEEGIEQVADLPSPSYGSNSVLRNIKQSVNLKRFSSMKMEPAAQNIASMMKMR